jgi:hypothetical protein
MRRFKLKKNTQARGAEWLNRETVYEGKLMSETERVVRLFAPDGEERRQHVDLPYEWVIPVH